MCHQNLGAMSLGWRWDHDGPLGQKCRSHIDDKPAEGKGDLSREGGMVAPTSPFSLPSSLH